MKSKLYSGTLLLPFFTFCLPAKWLGNKGIKTLISRTPSYLMQQSSRAFSASLTISTKTGITTQSVDFVLFVPTLAVDVVGVVIANVVVVLSLMLFLLLLLFIE